jgi:Asp-tRNA(Asn)/Glu-tRNA(Gln) amidotransferase A subunit family amidase
MATIPAREANHLSAVEAARAIREGELRSVDLVEACLSQIARRESVVGAWCWLDRDVALQRAGEADARLQSGGLIGPLHGLPIGIKDVFDTADMPSEYGSASLRGRRPGQDADAVAALRGAGGIIIGKTVTSEFGMYVATSCRNPHDVSRSAGVSSAGSAAAVADFMVPLALGTQHTASTLLPASFCGAFGFKPTSGFTSMRGSNILAPQLANIGFLARSVEDLALFVSVFSCAQVASPCKPPRLGWVRGPAWSKVAADADAAFAAFRNELPICLDEVELPSEFEKTEEITSALLGAHMAYRFGSLPEAAQEGYCAPLRDLVAAGRKLDARCDCQFQSAANHLAAAADRLFAGYDALMTLSALGEATLASDPGSGAMCMPWSLAGLPTVSLPLLRGAHGLPIGVQLVGRRGQDADLLSIAAWLSSAGLAKQTEA